MCHTLVCVIGRTLFVRTWHDHVCVCVCVCVCVACVVVFTTVDTFA